MRTLTRLLGLAALLAGLGGCLGTPAHNREHIRQMKMDMYGLHEDFDYFWELKAPVTTEYPIEQ